MRFRMGLVLGFGAGYVMGAKAGTQRYEQIRDKANRLMATDAAQKLKGQAEQTFHEVQDKARERFSKEPEEIRLDDLPGVRN